MKKTAVFLLLLTFTLPLFSQSSSSSELFAPFVSRIKAVVNDQEIVLSWKDSPDLENSSYEIYRHSEKITEENWEEATLMETINSGVMSYTWSPEDSNQYYFAIFGFYQNERIIVTIPYRTVTNKGVGITELALEEKRASQLSRLSAELEDKIIKVSWDSSKSAREILVFRSIKPITGLSSLKQAAVIGTFTGETIRYREEPLPGVPYYYAAVDKKIYQMGSPKALLPGYYTDSPLMLPLSELSIVLSYENKGKMKPLPLMSPGALYNGAMDTYLPIPDKNELKPETQAAVDTLLVPVNKNRTNLELKPEILPIDSAESRQMRQLVLQQILETSFMEEKWEEAADKLLLFKGEYGSGDYNYRVHYYRGQAYYFAGQYEKAFMEFLYGNRKMAGCHL